MKIAISNLAWDFKLDDKILEYLKSKNIYGLEIAPAKIFGGSENIFFKNNDKIIQNYRQKCIEKYKIKIIAFQSILFGCPEFQIFKSKKIRKKTLNYLKKMIELAQKFEAKNLVLGSPKNRDILDLSPQKAFSIAVDFFAELGEHAIKNKTCLCIEPNPKEYNCNFVCTSKEGAELVRTVSNEGFKLHLDSGAMYINQENYEKTIAENIDIIAHFHISNPQLKSFESTPVNHEKLGKILKENNYKNWVSIEMLPNENEKKGIKLALKISQNFYA